MKHLAMLSTTIFMASLWVVDLSIAAEGTASPGSSGSSNVFRKKLEPDKLLTTGGVKVQSGDDITVEPEFGVSHTVHERTLGSGLEDKTHKVHAQAGANIKLSDRFFLGFATKLPVYNYGATEKQSIDGTTTSSSPGRHEYEILHLSPNNLTWTGEMGLRLGQFIDLNLYYDQNIIKEPLQPGVKSEEEVIGTKFIFRFK
jgi:hypothetical protein